MKITAQYRALLKKFEEGTINPKEEKRLAKIEEMLGQDQTFGPASDVRHFRKPEDTEPYAITPIDLVTGKAGEKYATR